MKEFFFKVCTPTTARECQIRNVKSCNIVNEEKCGDTYVTQIENQCQTVNEKQCATTQKQVILDENLLDQLITLTCIVKEVRSRNF